MHKVPALPPIMTASCRHYGRQGRKLMHQTAYLVIPFNKAHIFFIPNLVHKAYLHLAVVPTHIAYDTRTFKAISQIQVQCVVSTLFEVIVVYSFAIDIHCFARISISG